MISGNLTPVQHSSKVPAGPGRPRPWLRLPYALLLVLGLLAVGCKKDVSSIGVGLPNAQTNTGAYLIDTLTIRASTVLRDSVVTSGSPYLLVGRYTDPLLGTLTAKSFFRLGLMGAFQPDPTFVYDSLTLTLKPDNYRYGDTTKTQALFEVHRLIDQLSDIKPLFAAPRFTPVNYDSTTLLNKGGAPVRRARPSADILRLPLSDDFGRDLLAKAQAGQLATQDAFVAYLPGLVLTAAATDNAAIVRMSASAAGSAMILYYHDPTNPTAVLSTSFTPAARHFYQIKADRSTAGTPNLPKLSLQGISSTLTGEQTFVEGALGLQTRLEFPYLTDVQQFGQNITVTSATALTALVPPGSITPFAPLPPNLTIYFTDASNHPINIYLNSGIDATGKQVVGVPSLTGISAQTNIEQSVYSWPMAAYCQAVINRNIPNNGLLLSSVTPTLPDRVVLGGPRNTQNKLKLRLYFITAN